jgi:hypothetical protein
VSGKPYAYYDAQNHRLAFLTTAGPNEQRYVWAQAENCAIGGDVTNVWLTIEQGHALDASLAHGITAQYADHTGDTLTVRPGDDFTVFEVARAATGDEPASAVRVVTLTARLFEIRAGLADAIARAEGRPTTGNERLNVARVAAADVFEVEVGERRPMWRAIYTDSESPTGIAPVCTAEGVDDVHHVIADHPSGPLRDDQGVYDCCPTPQIETGSTTMAAYLVELLNADAETGGKCTREGDATHRGQSGGEL